MKVLVFFLTSYIENKCVICLFTLPLLVALINCNGEAGRGGSGHCDLEEIPSKKATTVASSSLLLPTVSSKLSGLKESCLVEPFQFQQPASQASFEVTIEEEAIMQNEACTKKKKGGICNLLSFG